MCLIINLGVSQFGLDDVQVHIVKVLVTRLDISEQRPFPLVRHHAALEAVIVIDRMKPLVCQPIEFEFTRACPVVGRQTCMVFDQYNERGEVTDAPA